MRTKVFRLLLLLLKLSNMKSNSSVHDLLVDLVQETKLNTLSSPRHPSSSQLLHQLLYQLLDISQLSPKLLRPGPKDEERV